MQQIGVVAGHVLVLRVLQEMVLGGVATTAAGDHHTLCSLGVTEL